MEQENKQYIVLSFNRKTLLAIGFTEQEVALFTDAELERIAEMMREVYTHLEDICGIVHDFSDTLAFITDALLMGKETANQTGGAHEALDPGA